MKLTAESTVVNDDKLNTDITEAQTTADEAKTIADNTNQYFWFTSTGTDTGAHISEKTQEQFLSNPSGGNLLARSNGIAVRDGLTELSSFTGNSVRIGKAGSSHVDINADSIAMVQHTDTTDIVVFVVDWSDEFYCNIGVGSGNGIVSIRNSNSDARHSIYTHDADVGIDGNVFARNFKSGRTPSITVPANSYNDYEVTFNQAFDIPPSVVCSIYSTAEAGAIGSLTASAIGVTENGFTVRVFNAGSAQRAPAVDWIAVLTEDPVYII